MRVPFSIGRVRGAAKRIGGRGVVALAFVCVDGWKYLGKGTWPEPGLVVGHPASNESGHVGIVDFDGEGIAAGSVNVSRRFDEFLDGTSGFNKYVGNQEGEEDE